jgi:hypothetical protein
MAPLQRTQLILAADTARDFLIGVVLLYGYVYTAYKYGNPLTGGTDFFKYKEMVGRPFDFSATTAPFVLRQIPTIVASIFYKLGAHYDTMAVVDLIGFDRDTKRRFFALILSNALAICLSFTILAGYLRIKRGGNGDMTDMFALFGVFAAWFYFPTGAIAPQTVGWGWFVSTLFIVAFLERSIALTCIACLIGMFSRETTLVFALAFFSARLLFEDEHCLSIASSVLALVVGCLTYLVVRKLLTSGYEHQIDPQAIMHSLISPKFSPGYFFQSVLSQGLLAMLLLCIAIRQPRYAVYLVLGIGAVTVVGIGTQESQLAWVSGETLPFYATIFLLTQQSASPQNGTLWQ